MPLVRQYAEFRKLLGDHAKRLGAIIRTSARVVEITVKPDRAMAHLESGELVVGDLLIAADGVHSVVRRQFVARLADKLDKPELERAMEPDNDGSRIYRGLVPQEKLATVWLDHPALTKPYVVRGLFYRATRLRLTIVHV